MMTRRACAAILATTAGVTLGVLSARAEQEARTVAEFRDVAVAGKAEVDIKVGPERSLKLEGDGDVLKHVTTRVSNGKLSIACERSSFGRASGCGPYKAHVTTPHL